MVPLSDLRGRLSETTAVAPSLVLLCAGPLLRYQIALSVEASLQSHRAWQDRRDIENAADRQTAGLQAIVVILLLLVCSLFLVQQLRRKADLEDCLLSGRMDCVPPAVIAQ
jgi:hypothetical protein